MAKIYVGDGEGAPRVPKKIYIGGTDGPPKAAKKIYVGNRDGLSRLVYVAEHKHAYEWIGGFDPTCTDDGYDDYACSCGDTKTYWIDALGHSWSDWTTDEEPSCYGDGEESRYCYACGETQSSIIDALDHLWIEDARKEATCTENGYIAYSCGRDECEAVDDVTLWATGHQREVGSCLCMNCGEAVFHTWSELFREDATCTEDGCVEYECVECYETYTETLRATGHSYSTEVGRAGEIIYTCDKCGHTYTDWGILSLRKTDS